MTTMIPTEPTETRQVSFEEKDLPAEPASDVGLVLEDGRLLRERMVKVDVPLGISVVVTISNLDEKGGVRLRDDGSPELAPTHELVLTGEALARLGTPEKVKEAIEVHRQEAAAMASDYFRGLELADLVLGERLLGKKEG